MATIIQTIDTDIGTTNKPLRLQSASRYRNWKQRILNFMFVIDYNLWKSIVDSPSIPMVPAVEASGVSILKDSSRFTDAELTTRGKKQFFRNGHDILRLPVNDLMTLAKIKMITTKPKGFDFENYMRRLARDGFKVSLQPFTWTYYDTNDKDLVIDRGDKEHIRVYEVLDLRYLAPADIIAKSEMKVACRPIDEYEAKE
ncbi:hypothetical protein L1987_16366 [Smallanthus sonchifolius]|uniref:Uncharacterized protein n=1 Tax=Smallanthus sonchifolius TaxID=185202 RepID=A0ACB9JAE3_9ASTR|nr:hypothetical protein L1987_16366 [Smallanthus sonchifolius]